MFRRRIAPAVSMKSAVISALRFCATPPSTTPAKLATYADRHIGVNEEEIAQMLQTVGYSSLESFMDEVVPAGIRREKTNPMADFPALSEAEALAHYKALMDKNFNSYKTLIGQGYYEAITPSPIQRNMLESPLWYTPYTPYQSEISQGRLESIFNFQTAMASLTGLPIANASMLDEATASTEAMRASIAWTKFTYRNKAANRVVYAVDSRCFQSSVEMLQSRASPLGVKVVVCDIQAALASGGTTAKVIGTDEELDLAGDTVMGIQVQTPDREGTIRDFAPLFSAIKSKNINIICAVGTDLMALTHCKSPGEMGADIAFGNAQRFGIPLGYGGPHPAFFAMNPNPDPNSSRPCAFIRMLPARIVGMSKDAAGKPALRLALGFREQHIKRDAATSNICTAQALLANMAAMYAVYHGPAGLKAIGGKMHTQAKILAIGARLAGHELVSESFFDTVSIRLADSMGNGDQKPSLVFTSNCAKRHINVWPTSDNTVSVSIDEATTDAHIGALLECLGLDAPVLSTLAEHAAKMEAIPADCVRQIPFLTQKVFNTHHSETALMRYIHHLAAKDYGLQTGMVPLGSCTMKLNAASTMIPMSWACVGNLHPLVPTNQAEGYRLLAIALEERLRAVTGFAAVCLQPNSGAQGEYAGLRVIKAYHESCGETNRNICLLPSNAHGTNPASAVLAGMKVVEVKCKEGAVDIADLKAQLEKHGKNVAAAMITYPSVNGVFDDNIKEVTRMIHDVGGQVYIDGANFNAMNGFTCPEVFGGDVCHLNLHKTFSIPHGGGGPGMGPIGVRKHLAPFLPNTSGSYTLSSSKNQSLVLPPAQVGGSNAFGQVSQAAYGSASINGISYLMISMLGTVGLRKSTSVAILAANYIMERLGKDYSVMFRSSRSGRCAHEFIINMREFKSLGIEAEDVAKRLMDYGFHAPTVSFPENNALMIEPTESEPLEEIERFVEAMLKIRHEIRAVADGKLPKEDNPIHNAPHTADEIVSNDWNHSYSREEAVFPSAFVRTHKFWPSLKRVANDFGDLNHFNAPKETGFYLVSPSDCVAKKFLEKQPPINYHEKKK